MYQLTLQLPDDSELIACRDKVFRMLRDYQRECVALSLKNLEKRYDTLLQGGTGSGKSIMMSAVALYRLSKGEKVGLVIHKEELLRQWIRNFSHLLPPGFKIGIIGDKSRYSRHRDNDAQLQIMTVKTLYQDKKKPHLDLLILDEAHHSPAKEWAGCVDYYRTKHNALIFGATATPKRLDGKPLDEFTYKIDKQTHTIPGFSTLVPGPQISELMALGFLVKVETFASKFAVNSDSWKIKMGEYERKTMASEMAKINPEDVYREWMSIIGNNKLTVAYPSSVEYSKNLNWYFNEQMPGISAHIDSNTPAKEREQILADFADGKIKVLFQHSIVIEGVDIPKIEAILCLRPTASIPVWLQILGRGLRPSPGKDKLILLDFTDNHQKLPMPHDEIIWDLRDPEVVDNILPCPECDKPRRFDVIELSDHGFFSKVLKKCTKCGLEIWSHKPHAKPSKKRGDKKDDIYSQLEIGAIFKPILPPKDFDFSSKPQLIRFTKGLPNPDPAMIHSFVSTLSAYRKSRGIKPFWGMFEVCRQWYGYFDNDPDDDVLFLLHNAFLEPEDQLQMPDRVIAGMEAKINRARKKWHWTLGELMAKGEVH